MQFMAIVKADKRSEAGIFPSRELFEKMGKYNEELEKAGVLLAAEGLQPSSKGTRVRFSGKNRVVTQGPFPETEHLVAGFWLWQVKSKEEAIDWLKRAPFDDGVEVELRQVYEAADFADAFPADVRREEEGMRDRLAARR